MTVSEVENFFPAISIVHLVAVYFWSAFCRSDTIPFHSLIFYRYLKFKHYCWEKERMQNHYNYCDAHNGGHDTI